MPNQMFTHKLNPTAGYPSLHAIDTIAPFSANVTTATLSCFSGRVVHKNSVGEYELGAKLNQVAFSIYEGIEKFSVSNNGGVDANAWYATTPTGKARGLSHTGCYCFETTEFDTTAVYNYNDNLHAPTEDQITLGGYPRTNAGLLFNAKNYTASATAMTPYTDHICGIVALPPFANEYRVNVLTFYPVHLPGLSG